MAADRTPSLDGASRLWALAASAACLLPLLLQLPWLVAAGSALLGVLTATLSWRRPMPAILRLVLAVAILAIVANAMGFRFGRDTGCALLTALLAIKPSETSTLRDARSLLGFALFAPFAAFLLDQGPLTLVLSGIGIIAALLALGRLADAEAAITTTVPLRQRLWLIGRLILIGLPLIGVAFWLFPRFASPLWGVPGKAIATPGLSERMSPGGWLDLMSDDRPALRVQFFGSPPRQQEMYWRAMVLWDFDGRSWTRSPMIASLPAAPVREAATRWDYEISVEPNEQRWLTSLDVPSAAPDGTRLDHDRTLVSDRPLTSLTRWRMASAMPQTFDTGLPQDIRDRALRLPDGFNPRTRALAATWRAQAGRDDEAIIRRAMQWIRSDFIYTLDTPLPGRDAVDEFLFTQKRGYCEHFSSSFTVLMRAAGIPARVVVGYAGGYRNGLGDYWLVRNQDAHAWSEVWLAGRGWVRVDPTAAVAPERIYDTIDDRDGVDGAAETAGATLFDVSDWLRRNWNDLVLGFDARRQEALLQGLGLPRLEQRRLALLFALMAVLSLLVMGWLLARGERERDPLLRAWHRLGRRYRRHGLAPEPHEPALAWARRVAASASGDAELILLSQRFAAARYAPGESDIPALVRDIRRHRPVTRTRSRQPTGDPP